MNNTETNARASATADQAAAVREFLAFKLGTEEYGIDILKVQEIRGFEQPTRMVNAPAEVLGVLNLRGIIVPVVDLRLKFGMGVPVYDSQTVTIVLNLRSQVAGMVVDAVSDVVALRGEQIKPAPDFSGAVNASQVIGIATVTQGEAQRMLILLDIERVMRRADDGLQFTFGTSSEQSASVVQVGEAVTDGTGR